MLTQQRKEKLKFALSIIGAVLLAGALFAVFLTMGQRQARDIARLSAVRGLQADLALYYNQYHHYPQRLEKKSGRTDQDCAAVLCLPFWPADPETGVLFQYASCQNESLDSCSSAAAPALSYAIAYRLEKSQGQARRGTHYARPEGLWPEIVAP